MITFTDLKTVVTHAVGWEKKLKDFYDVAEYALRSPESKKVITLLSGKLADQLKILENVDLDETSGWIQFAFDYRDEELMPIQTITRDSSPKDIIRQILEFEKKLLMYYSNFKEKIVRRYAKELFASLVTFKEYQISELENLLNTLD